MIKKSKLLTVIVVFQCFLFNFSLGFSQDKDEVENKINVITEILHLGKVDSENPDSIDEIFALIHDVTIDSSENIIVVDTRMKNLRKYNLAGKLLNQYSVLGKGPGEIESPWLIENNDEQIFVFDLELRKIITFSNNFIFEKEFKLPYSIHDMIISPNKDFFVTGVIESIDGTTKNPPIHIFDHTGKLKDSFGKEIKFDASNITDSFARMMVYDYYAGWIALHIWNNKLLASPVFDNHIFVYDLKGQFLHKFKNSDFKYKLLNYSIKKRAVFYSQFETQSGPAFGLTDNFIIKSYQVSLKKEHIEHFLDIFDSGGKLIQSQIPINGMVMDVTESGLFVTASYHPFSQIWVYRVNFEQFEE